jgi:hypothetical protein
MKKIRKEDYFALAQFLMDYHSGQWSRGYRLLSRLKVRGNWSPRFCNELRNTEIYFYLEANYAGKV